MPRVYAGNFISSHLEWRESWKREFRQSVPVSPNAGFENPSSGFVNWVPFDRDGGYEPITVHFHTFW